MPDIDADGGAGCSLTYSSNQPGALDTVASIEKEGGTAIALQLDVGSGHRTHPAQ